MAGPSSHFMQVALPVALKRRLWMMCLHLYSPHQHHAATFSLPAHSVGQQHPTAANDLLVTQSKDTPSHSLKSSTDFHNSKPLCFPFTSLPTHKAKPLFSVSKMSIFPSWNCYLALCSFLWFSLWFVYQRHSICIFIPVLNLSPC